MGHETDHNTKQENSPLTPERSNLKWDTSGLRASYCNIANATANRDDVNLHFGAKPRRDTSHGEPPAQLLHRIVLRPLTAKNLHHLLSRVIAEHDTGKLEPKR